MSIRLSIAARRGALLAALVAAAGCGGGGGGDIAAAPVPIGSGGTGLASGSGPGATPTAAPASGPADGPAVAAGPGAQPDTETAGGTRDFAVTSGAGDEGQASVAVLPAGGFVAAWAEAGGGIRLQRFDAQGARVGNPVVVADRGSAPGVAVLAGGGFLVTWSSSPYMYEAHADAQRFDAQGQPVGAPFALARSFFKYVVQPLGLPGGGFVVAADTITGRYGSEYAELVQFSGNGTRLGTLSTFRSTLSPQTGALDPNAARDSRVAGWPDGRLATAWVASGTGVAELRLTRIDAAGAVNGEQVVMGSAQPLRLPSVAALADGGVALAWVEGSYGQPQVLYLEVLDGSGASRGRRVVAQADTGGLVPSLGAGSGGELLLAWRAETVEGDTARLTTRLQRFSASGQPLAAAQAIASTTAPAAALGQAMASLDVSALPDGRALVLHGAWDGTSGWDVRGAIR